MLVRRVHDPTVPQVCAADEANIHQQVEGAVNGGEVERLAAHMDHGKDFLGSHVTIAVSDCIHDHLSLRGNPVAALAEFIKKSVTMGHCEHPLLQLFATRLYQKLSELQTPCRQQKGQVICLPSNNYKN
jgi:hypothetical protein